MVTHTKVQIGRKRYVVTHAGPEIVRINYDNAVLGSRPLDLTGRLAKQVLAKFRENVTNFAESK